MDGMILDGDLCVICDTPASSEPADQGRCCPECVGIDDVGAGQ